MNNDLPKWYGVISCKDPIKALENKFPELLLDDVSLQASILKIKEANKEFLSVLSERFEEAKNMNK